MWALITKIFSPSVMTNIILLLYYFASECQLIQFRGKKDKPNQHKLAVRVKPEPRSCFGSKSRYLLQAVPRQMVKWKCVPQHDFDIPSLGDHPFARLRALEVEINA
nr:uncharacterized protein LOC113697864 [Coffea arabica]